VIFPVQGSASGAPSRRSALGVEGHCKPGTGPEVSAKFPPSSPVSSQASLVKSYESYLAILPMLGSSNISPEMRGALGKPLGRSLEGKTRCEASYSETARPSCLRLLAHCERRADSRADCTAGISNAARMP